MKNTVIFNACIITMNESMEVIKTVPYGSKKTASKRFETVE